MNGQLYFNLLYISELLIGVSLTSNQVQCLGKRSLQIYSKWNYHFDNNNTMFSANSKSHNTSENIANYKQMIQYCCNRHNIAGPLTLSMNANSKDKHDKYNIKCSFA